MKTTDPIDAARLALLLAELRLPAVKQVWADLAAQADKEGWPAARFLAALAEHEMAERSRRRIERHLAEARLPPGKTLDTFDFEAVPVVSKAQIMALAAGDAWLDKGANLILFGPPGTGKSHLAAALSFALVENGWRVLFARTTDLAQRLQIARRELTLEAAIARLDKYHLLILDDLAYVTKDQAETSVLFELIGARYERRSLLVTGTSRATAAAPPSNANAASADAGPSDNQHGHLFVAPRQSIQHASSCATITTRRSCVRRDAGVLILIVAVFPS
jgi:DNA replication protein DnaC